MDNSTQEVKDYEPKSSTQGEIPGTDAVEFLKLPVSKVTETEKQLLSKFKRHKRCIYYLKMVNKIMMNFS